MNIQELQRELQALGVKDSNYSLIGYEKPDAIILKEDNPDWEVYYFDERGGRGKGEKFPSESEACEYILKKFQKYVREKFIKPNRS